LFLQPVLISHGKRIGMDGTLGRIKERLLLINIYCLCLGAFVVIIFSLRFSQVGIKRIGFIGMAGLNKLRGSIQTDPNQHNHLDNINVKDKYIDFNH